MVVVEGIKNLSAVLSNQKNLCTFVITNKKE